jgi:hypothetical protein
MGLLQRGGDLKSARRAMRGVTDGEQRRGMALAEAAQDTATSMGHPSRLALGMLSVVAAASSIDDDDPRLPVLLLAGSIGYACRMVYAHALAAGTVASIEQALPRFDDGKVNIDALEDDLDSFKALVDWSSSVAGNPWMFEQVSGCEIPVWQAFAVTAGYSIQANCRAKGIVKAAVLGLDELDDLLRIGFTLRVIDEVAGLEPQHEMFSEGSSNPDFS